MRCDWWLLLGLRLLIWLNFDWCRFVIFIGKVKVFLGIEFLFNFFLLTGHSSAKRTFHSIIRLVTENIFPSLAFPLLRSSHSASESLMNLLIFKEVNRLINAIIFRHEKIVLGRSTTNLLLKLSLVRKNIVDWWISDILLRLITFFHQLTVHNLSALASGELTLWHVNDRMTLMTFHHTSVTNYSLFITFETSVTRVHSTCIRSRFFWLLDVFDRFKTFTLIRYIKELTQKLWNLQLGFLFLRVCFIHLDNVCEELLSESLWFLLDERRKVKELFNKELSYLDFCQGVLL